MADNIEDFLRRAAERRQQRASKPAPQQPPRSEPPPPPPPKASVTPKQPRKSEPDRIRPVQQPPAQLHSTIESRQTLAQKIETADDSMRDHLQNVFSHQLGNIPKNQRPGSDPVTKSPKPENQKAAEAQADDASSASLAQLVAASLRDPQTTKIAFVASEIFKRRF